jgi:hypothetical protein
VLYGERADATAVHIPISAIQRRSATPGADAGH